MELSDARSMHWQEDHAVNLVYFYDIVALNKCENLQTQHT